MLFSIILAVATLSEPRGQWERATAYQWREANGQVVHYFIDVTPDPQTRKDAMLLGWRLLTKRPPFLGTLWAYAVLTQTGERIVFDPPLPAGESERDGASEP